MNTDDCYPLCQKVEFNTVETSGRIFTTLKDIKRIDKEEQKDLTRRKGQVM